VIPTVWIRQPIAVVMLLFELGCQPHAVVLPHAVPVDFAIKLHRATASGQVTYFEIDRDRTLRYAGGADAVGHVSHPVTTLSTEQSGQVWRIVREHKLHHALNQPFTQAESTTYYFTLNYGGRARTIRSVDDKTAGLEALHDLLFGIQMGARYD